MAERPATALLSGWGRVSPSHPADLSRPSTSPELDALLSANEAAGGRGLIARGLGRSYGDAAQNAGGAVLDMTDLAGVQDADLETGRATVGSGTSLDTLVRRFLPWGWFPAVTPGTRFVTVGGAIAADVHGKNHHRDGGFSDFVDSFDIWAPEGGSETVTADSDADAFWATCGGMGLTGVLTRAVVRFTPVQTARMRVDTERASDVDEVMALMESGDEGYQYSVAWIDGLARGRSLGRGVLTRANHMSLDELSPDERPAALNFSAETKFEVPPVVPSRVLGRPAARAFNEVWFRKAPLLERGRPVPILSYFYPLDAVRNWNRLYGPRGFVQYQFVVPFGREEIVHKVLEELSFAGCASFLAVLKRFGAGHGLLSFPIPGWTLALDLPAWEGDLPAVLDRFDEMIAEAGGRVYLAKDSRMRPELLRQMYPELDRWREIRSRMDPRGHMMSDLDRRLDLSGDRPGRSRGGAK